MPPVSHHCEVRRKGNLIYWSRSLPTHLSAPPSPFAMVWCKNNMSQKPEFFCMGWCICQYIYTSFTERCEPNSPPTVPDNPQKYYSLWNLIIKLLFIPHPPISYYRYNFNTRSPPVNGVGVIYEGGVFCLLWNNFRLLKDKLVHHQHTCEDHLVWFPHASWIIFCSGLYYCQPN